LFADMGSDKSWRAAVQSGVIEDLARARQSLESSLGVAQFRLKQIREHRAPPARPRRPVRRRTTKAARPTPLRVAK
jgi:hypothetical protein